MQFDLTRQTFFQSLCFSIIVVGFYLIGYYNITITAQNQWFESSGITFIGNNLKLIFDKHPILNQILKTLFLFINSLFLSRIYIRNVVYLKRSHISTLIYLLSTISLFTFYNTITVYLVAFLSLFSIEFALSVRKHVNCARYYFLSLFLVGTSTIFFIPSFSVIAIPITFIFANNRFYLKEIISMCVGLLFPFFLISYYYWATTGDFFLFINNFYEQLVNNYVPFNLEFIFSNNPINLLLILFVIILGIFNIIIHIKNHSGRAKIKNSIIIVWSFTVILFSILFFMPGALVYSTPLLTIPLSLLVAQFFNLSRNNIITNIVFVIFILLSIISLYYNISE